MAEPHVDSPAPPGLSGKLATVVVLGVLAFLAVVFGWLFLLVAETARDMKSQAHLKQIGLAFCDYSKFSGGARAEIPPAAVYDRDGKPLYSWRVLLLPYLGESDLFREFRLDEAWDSPHNIQLLPRIPEVYQVPGVNPGAEGLTFYQVFTGPETPFATAKTKLERYTVQPGLSLWAPPRPRYSLVQGTGNTVAVVEAADPVPWTRPADLVYDAKAPFPRLGGVFRNRVNTVFFDGAVKQIPQKTAGQVLREAVNPEFPLPDFGTW
jgi:hypothetical protein